MKANPQTRLSNPVAERRLTVTGAPGATVVVILGKPRRAPGQDYRCSFRIEGLGDNLRQFAYGADSLQALLMAVEGARVTLERSGLQLAWLGGEPGDTGIPRMVPGLYGRAFAQSIEHHIDQEVEKFARVADRLYKEWRAGGRSHP